MGYDLKYVASKTCSEFLMSRAPRKILCGPVGGGKSSACIMAILTNAMQQEPDNDGIRRTRHLVIRGTYSQLKTTTIKSFLDWLPPEVFGKYLSSERTYYLEFESVRAEILFLSIEDEQDIRKILSLETTTCFINEGKEVSEEVINGIIGTKRIGRYPSRKQGPGATYAALFIDTNAPAYDTYHYRIMEGIEGDFVTFRQPGGRSPEAENLEFLPPDYYSTEGLTEEHVRVFIDCEYGTSKEGMPVFRRSFISEFHISESPLLPITSPDYPILIGLDAGLTPAAILGQMAPNGRVNILGECFTEKNESIGMERFLTSRLIPMMKNKYPGCGALVVVDPASTQMSQANELSVFKVIETSGLKVRTAASNKIDLRIGSAETLLGKQVGGKAGLLIDKNCVGLIGALKHGYKFAARKDGDMEEKPLKDHPNSDIGDAFCYLTSYIIGNSGIHKTARRELKSVSSKGWT